MQKNQKESGVVLNKYLSNAGVTSRRKAVELIESGAVSVNGKKVKKPYYQVQKGDVVEVNGTPVSAKSKKYIYILLNKPVDCLTSLSDDRGRKTVIDVLGSQVKERVYPVGRLDWETTGALLLTNDGDLAQKLGHPRFGVEKEYHVRLNKPLTWDDMHAIKKGVRLSDGMVTVDNVAFFEGKSKALVRVALHSGKYRIIRRLFKKLGYEVDKLDRARFAGLSTRGIKKGGWRYLTSAEVERLKGS